MPQRFSRDNARNHKQRAQREHRASPSLSPPAQLPTPLPDEKIPHFPQLLLPTIMEPPGAHQQSLGSPFGHEAPVETSSSPLINFDTPPSQPASLPGEESNIDDQEEIGSGGALASMYRSPPFREAPLPNQVGSSPPLPIPPRIPYPQDYFEDVGLNDPVIVGLSGHIRSPAFSRYVLVLLVLFLALRFASHISGPLFHKFPTMLVGARWLSLISLLNFRTECKFRRWRWLTSPSGFVFRFAFWIFRFHFTKV